MDVGHPERGRHNSRITLVPFAGFNLIRFRGSRINGLSPVWALRQDKAPDASGMKVTYSLNGRNSSRTCQIAFIVGAALQIVIECQDNELIFQ